MVIPYHGPSVLAEATAELTATRVEALQRRALTGVARADEGDRLRRVVLARLVVPRESDGGERRHLGDERLEQRVYGGFGTEPEREQQRVGSSRLVRQFVHGAEDGPHRVAGGRESGRTAEEPRQCDVVAM